MREDARLRRCATLGAELWGKTPDDLQRRLLAPHPEIPLGYDLADFRELQQHTQMLSVALSDPRTAWLPTWAFPIIFVGTQEFTVWEARCEVVRRVIEFLENHG